MDIILYNIVVALVSLLIGYVFGSIPTGVIIGKVFFHRDPRKEGSNNSGGTNVGRLFGKKIGLLVIFIDILKCVIPFVITFFIIKYSGLANLLKSEAWDNFHILYIYLSPLGVVIGHCWPLFANFKGGKAVATFCGFGLATSWCVLLTGLLSFLGMLKAKKYVSLSSIFAAIVSSVVTWLLFILKMNIGESINIVMWGAGSYLPCGWEYASICTLISLILILRHKANIKRLINKNERKITWLK